MAIVHAFTMANFNACTMSIVHACTMHVLWPKYMYDYGHSTCVHYGHSTCMHYDHSTCMYFGHIMQVLWPWHMHVLWLYRRWKKKLDQLIRSCFAATQFKGMPEQVHTQHLSLTSCSPPYPQVQCCEQCWRLQCRSQHWSWGGKGALDFWNVLAICRFQNSHFWFFWIFGFHSSMHSGFWAFVVFGVFEFADPGMIRWSKGVNSITC